MIEYARNNPGVFLMAFITVFAMVYHPFHPEDYFITDIGKGAFAGLCILLQISKEKP